MANDLFGDKLFGDVFGEAMDDLFSSVKKTTHTVVRASIWDDVASSRSYRSISDESGVTLEVDLPGVDPKDVSLWQGSNQLIVEGKRGDKTFTHRYTLAPGFDVKTATASISNGQLKVRVLGSQSSAATQVPIEVK
jgi:HSP20 family molecular chaperone IbpA